MAKRRLTDADGIYQFSAGEAAWIFSAGLATFAVVMVLAGRWLAKAGPRKMAVSGGLLLGAGYLLGGFFGSGFWTQLFFIGILGGAGIGRIAWGSISDRIGRRQAIVLMTLLQGLTMLSIYHGFISLGSVTGLIVGSSIIGFNFGGNFALFPAATADYFGNKNVGANYGWVFTAYGIAGIAGPQIAGYFKDAAQGALYPTHWMPPFIIAGVVCLLGAAIMYFAGVLEDRRKIAEKEPSGVFGKPQFQG